MTKENGTSISDPMEILDEEANFFKRIYESKNTNPELDQFKFFFQRENITPLEKEESDSCEGLLSLEECANVLKSFSNDKTPGSDGLTVEFYRFFWNIVGNYVVESFNHAFQKGCLSISQKLGLISLIPKKQKNPEFLKNWRPISLLNTDYKIATKAIAVRLEKVLPSIIHPSQTGYIKGRYIGECIRLLSDTMAFTKQRNISGAAIFLDFEKAFDSIEWNYLQKCLSVFKFGPQLRHWINVFYNDISSCVLNNGYASEHFNLQWGVRQGCPLSGLLFVIGIEILGVAIRASNSIKGIEIKPGKTIKLAQYADDTTVIVKDVPSIYSLFDLLALFENCSGLRINQSKSELLWLGSARHQNDTILNLNQSDEPILALGVYFSYNDKLAAKRNFFDKLDPLKKVLNIWSARDLSIYGRINIVKTLALSKLTFVCSVLETPPMFSEEVNKIIYEYIWKYKQPKIKKTTIMKRKEEGGLNMTDFTLFDKALKLCWVKRLCSSDDSPWKIIPNALLSNLGGPLLFRCNYDTKYVNINEQLPKFYKDIISFWQDLTVTVPHQKKETLNQIIWNNRFIRVDGSSVFYNDWYHAGIQQLSCLLDKNGSQFLTINGFNRKFNLKCNFLQYYSLLSAIPQQWKNNLKLPELEMNRAPTPIIDNLSCKEIYNLLIRKKNLPPPTADKRLKEHGLDANKIGVIYSLPFRVTKEIKLAIFQYKVIHNILYTNNVLFKMKKISSSSCPFCNNVDQTNLHLFVDCPLALSFWSEFTHWYFLLCNKKLSLSKLEIMYGVLQPSCLTLNHLILIGKYFLYTCSLNDRRYHFGDFIALVWEKIEIEKHIATSSDKLNFFRKKWSCFLSFK